MISRDATEEEREREREREREEEEREEEEKKKIENESKNVTFIHAFAFGDLSNCFDMCAQTGSAAYAYFLQKIKCNATVTPHVTPLAALQ